jgi:hypothetical protein
MAAATDKIVWWTRLQVALGFAGTLALIYTLHLNWRSTDAAIKAVQSERAWIVLAGFDSGPMQNGNVDGQFVKDGLYVIPRWINSGRSPSLDSEGYTRFELIGPGEDIPFFEAPRPDTIRRSAVVGPNREFNTPILGLNDPNTKDVKTGAKRMIIYSKVTYTDIYNRNQTRSSETCVEVEFNGTEQGPDGKVRPRIGFMPVGNQNSVT